MDPARRVAAFQQSVRDAQADLRRLDEMTDQIAAIEVTEHSPDRSVTVVAGPSGAVRSIVFDESALARGPEALSRLTTTTFQQAVAKAARLQAELVERYAGDRLGIAAKVNAVQAELANPPHRNDGFERSADPRDEQYSFGQQDAEQPPAPPVVHERRRPRPDRGPDRGPEDDAAFEFHLRGR